MLKSRLIPRNEKAGSLVLVRVDRREQIAAVAALAREIWTQHYTPIIGAAQVAYMLERF